MSDQKRMTIEPRSGGSKTVEPDKVSAKKQTTPAQPGTEKEGVKNAD